MTKLMMKTLFKALRFIIIVQSGVIKPTNAEINEILLELKSVEDSVDFLA